MLSQETSQICDAGIVPLNWKLFSMKRIAIFCVFLGGISAFFLRYRSEFLNDGNGLFPDNESEIEQVQTDVPEWDPSDSLSSRFLGATTIAFSNGRDQVLIDAFLSRRNVRQTLMTPLESDSGTVDKVLRIAKIDNLKAVFISHSHFDHILDVGQIALRTGAGIYGTSSTGNVAAGALVPSRQIHLASKDSKISLGGFDLQVFETPHSPLLSFPGVIAEPLQTPARIYQYREGGNLSYRITSGGKSALVVPSANYANDVFKNVKADIVFLGSGGIGSQPQSFFEAYWKQTVVMSEAKKVVLIHWDDFTRSIFFPLKPFPQFVDRFDLTLARFKELAVRSGIELVMPQAFEIVSWAKD